MGEVEEKEEGTKVNKKVGLNIRGFDMNNMSRLGDVMVYKKDTNNIPNFEDKVVLNIKGFYKNNMPRLGDAMVYKKNMSSCDFMVYPVDKVDLSIKDSDKNNMSCFGDAMVYKKDMNSGHKVGSSFDKNNMPCSGDAKVYKKDASQNYGDKVDSNMKGLDRNSLPRSDDVTVYKKDTPLWMRKPEDVSHEEYASFYKALSKDQEDHFAVKHFSVDGLLSFHALLFVPRQEPFDLFEKNRNKFKTYIRRVLIMEGDEILPVWLNMIKGVVDFEESPLDISRDRDKIEHMIKQILVTKCLEMFAEIADKKYRYKKFYDQFGMCLKLGVHEDPTNRTKIVELLRYRTSKSGDEQISLNEYVDRMKEGQNDIYYITGESIIVLSPADIHHKMDLEVLHMCDAFDEHALLHLTEFHGKRLVCLDVIVLDEMD